jgi:alpha-aminoadipic semialdehyde synthase
MYWDDRYPRLLTREQLKTLRSKGNQNLKVVADVSCDLEGGIEFLSHCTTMAHPFYTYFPEIMKEKEGVHRDGVLVLGLDTLPTELPKEASEAFGKALLPLLPSLLDSKGSATPADMSDLPPELRRACIASHGELLPRWSYIARLREQEAVLKSTTAYGTATTGARGDYDVRTTDIEITVRVWYYCS